MSTLKGQPQAEPETRGASRRPDLPCFVCTHPNWCSHCVAWGSQIDLASKSPQDSGEGGGAMRRRTGVIRRRVGLLAILVPLVAGCGLPSTGAEPTAASAAVETPASTPVVLDVPGVTQNVAAALARMSGR